MREISLSSPRSRKQTDEPLELWCYISSSNSESQKNRVDNIIGTLRIKLKQIHEKIISDSNG